MITSHRVDRSRRNDYLHETKNHLLSNSIPVHQVCTCVSFCFHSLAVIPWAKWVNFLLYLFLFLFLSPNHLIESILHLTAFVREKVSRQRKHNYRPRWLTAWIEAEWNESLIVTNHQMMVERVEYCVSFTSFFILSPSSAEASVLLPLRSTWPTAYQLVTFYFTAFESWISWNDLERKAHRQRSANKGRRIT